MNIAASALTDILCTLLNSPPYYSLPSPHIPKIGKRDTTTLKQSDDDVKLSLSSSSSPAASDNKSSITIYQHMPCYTLQMYLRMMSLPYTLVNVPYHRLYGGLASYPVMVRTTANGGGGGGGGRSGGGAGGFGRVDSVDSVGSVDSVEVVVSGNIGGGGGECFVSNNTSLSSDGSGDGSGDGNDTHRYVLKTTNPFEYLTKPTSVLDDDAVSSSSSSSSSSSVAPPATTLSAELLLHHNMVDNVCSINLCALTYLDEGPGYATVKRRWLLSSSNVLSKMMSSWVLWGLKVSVLRAMNPTLVPVSRNSTGGFFRGASTVHLNVGVCLQKIKDCYDVIEGRLERRSDGNHYFFDTPTPTTFDAKLFGHVVAALGNYHTVGLIAEYHNILKWFVMVKQKWWNEEIDKIENVGEINECNRFYDLEECYLYAKRVLERNKAQEGEEGGRSGAETGAETGADEVVRRSMEVSKKRDRVVANLYRARFQSSMMPDKGARGREGKDREEKNGRGQGEVGAKVRRNIENENLVWLVSVGIVSAFVLIGGGRIRITPG
jgi:hypothetical protein